MSRDMLLGAAMMYAATGLLATAVILWYDLPYKVTWRLLLLPLLALMWPYYVWRAIASYHGRG